jgi:hypothetical protein
MTEREGGDCEIQERERKTVNEEQMSEVGGKTFGGGERALL